MSIEDSSQDNQRVFDAQFANRQTIEFPNHKVEIVDISPETLKDDTPILLVPGWSENPSTYKKTMQVLNNGKRRAITLDFDRERELAEIKNYLIHK